MGPGGHHYPVGHNGEAANGHFEFMLAVWKVYERILLKWPNGNDGKSLLMTQATVQRLTRQVNLWFGKRHRIYCEYILHIDKTMLTFNCKTIISELQVKCFN